jgi:hypothetical protein
MNHDSNDVDERLTCTPDEWTAILSNTRRQILEPLDRWRDEDRRIAAIFMNLKQQKTPRNASRNPSPG